MATTTELRADDFTVGTLCTVLSSKEQQESSDHGTVQVALLAGINMEPFQRFIGQALEIRAVDLPFVVVRFYKWSGGGTLDTRKVKLVRISREFAEAQAPEYPWWKFWKKFW